LHGKFEFKLQKYDLDGLSVSFLDLRQPMPISYISRGLQELSVYYSNRMSYQEVARLIERYSGAKVLSAQTIWQLVQQSALQVSNEIERQVGQSLLQTRPVEVTCEIDLDAADAEEVLLFDDGISVKAQKPERERTLDLQERKTSQPQIEYGRRVLTDVVVVQTAPGQFEYVSAPMAADGSLRCSLVEVVQAKVQQVYGHRSLPLPLVVICDGASVIRQRWTQTFGKDVVIILDWYHLTKKLRNLMSMIASTKAEKLAHLKVLFTHLWQGQSGAAINYLRQQVNPKNWEKWQELLTYLEKHQSEIINYERRRQAGKSIGSGRVEKAVDQVIAQRQKHQGKSWRPQGSRALGLLKVLELNRRWHQFWFSQHLLDQPKI
jgi:hypothetical protein